MITPKHYLENLKNNIVTISMLEDALFSVNKRAKNYRDLEKEKRYDYGIYSYQNAESLRKKKEELYDKKEQLLSIIEPICIHKEFFGYERIRVYDYEDEYLQKYFFHFLHGTIVWKNCYMDWDNDTTVYFFDYVNLDCPKYKYYLYYLIGNHTFHNPIENPEKYNLPIQEINRLQTTGMDIQDLISLQFVNKLLEVIKENNYKLIKDKESVMPLFSNYKSETLNLIKPDWFEIWSFIHESLKVESMSLSIDIRPLSEEEKKNIFIKQKQKKVKKKKQKEGIINPIWLSPKVSCPKFKIPCPAMNKELRNFIEKNYKEEMGEKEFAQMILRSPLSNEIKDRVEKYCSMKVYCQQLQKTADKLYETNHSEVCISDVWDIENMEV